jgi:RNA polymerase sigma-70 factor (ECF subfamily)
MGVPTASPDAAVADQDTRTILWRAIAELPERQREVLTLRWQHELAWDDIAHALGATSAAVQMQHSRAIRALRAKLTDYLA